LYAFVVDPALADRPLWELLLRLWALSTFVHEVAHHDDEMRRTARGRWHLEPCEKAEDYAIALQAEWTRDVVVPYLERTYPATATRSRSRPTSWSTWATTRGRRPWPARSSPGTNGTSMPGASWPTLTRGWAGGSGCAKPPNTGCGRPIRRNTPGGRCWPTGR